MAPAEIWQDRKIIYKVQGTDTHMGILDGKVVVVISNNSGCELIPGGHLKNGDSKKLDGGKIIKVINR